jgi:predicted AAA+ superfamily ATPase
LAKELKLKYVTFDNETAREMAEDSPHLFLENHTTETSLIIDEAQKVPKIFDSIKEIVDLKRIPGSFILLGSTEFSLLTNIRESLTGRASRVQLFPLLLSESKHLPLNSVKAMSLFNQPARVSLKEVLVYLERGGMPGIFAVRDEEERTILISDWLQLTCQRDILQIKKFRLEPNLCYKILQGVALLEFADETALCKFTGVGIKKMKNHLLGLESLFALHKIPAHALSTGKHLYFHVDVAFVHFFKGDMLKKMRTFILQEQIAQRSYRGELHTQISFFRSSKGSYVDFIIEHGPSHLTALKIFHHESLNMLDVKIIESFKQKVEKANQLSTNIRVDLCAVAPIKEKVKIRDVEIFPLEAIC